MHVLSVFQGIVWSNGTQNDHLRQFAAPCVFPGLGSVTLEQRIQTEAKELVRELLTLKGDSDTLKRLFYQAICNINCGIIFGSRYVAYHGGEIKQYLSLVLNNKHTVLVSQAN